MEVKFITKLDKKIFNYNDKPFKAITGETTMVAFIVGIATCILMLFIQGDERLSKIVLGIISLLLLGYLFGD